MKIPKGLAALAPLLAVILLIVVAACTGGGDSTSTPAATSATGNATATPGGDGESGGVAGSGTLEVRVTDAPNWAITAIYVTASQVEVAGANDAWTTVISEPLTFELLALQGVEAVLGESPLAAGRYTQVRLSVPEVEVQIDGDSVIAEVPSDKIRLVGTFTIEEGTKTYIALDFDAEQSLVQRGPNGYLFKPVIKLEVGEPGEEGEETVELPTKSEGAGDGAQPSPTAGPTATSQVPATPTAPATAAPTSTPEPTATPDPLGAFFLSIEAPSDPEVIVEEAQYEVVGRTSVDAFVTVNDGVAEIDADGRFAVTVNLEEGPNIVEVVASTAGGDQDSQVLVIIYEPSV